MAIATEGTFSTEAGADILPAMHQAPVAAFHPKRNN